MKTLLNLLRLVDGEGERYIGEADNKQQRALHHHNIMKAQHNKVERWKYYYTLFLLLDRTVVLNERRDISVEDNSEKNEKIDNFNPPDGGEV